MAETVCSGRTVVLFSGSPLAVRNNADTLKTGDVTFPLPERIYATREYDRPGYPLVEPLKVALVSYRSLPASLVCVEGMPTENQFCDPTKVGGLVEFVPVGGTAWVPAPNYTRTNFDAISELRIRLVEDTGKTIDTQLEWTIALRFI